MSEENVSSIFIPGAVFAHLLHQDKGAPEGLQIRSLTAFSEGFNIPGFVITGTAVAVDAFKKLYDLTPRHGVVTGPKEVMQFCTDGENGVLSSLITVTVDESAAIENMTDRLMRLSELIGMDMQFFIRRGGNFTPPLPMRREMHIVLGAAPSGECRESAAVHQCGIRLHRSGTPQFFSGPTPGRGRVVHDEENNPIAQIVGRCIYLLVPTKHEEGFHILSREGSGLFFCVLVKAWHAFLESEELSEIDVTDESFRNYVNSSLMAESEGITEDMIIIDRRIRETLTEYRALLQLRREKVRLSQVVGKPLIEDVLKPKFPSDFSRIREHPLVRRVAHVSQGIHVYTKCLVSDPYDSARRLYGEYIIRFGKKGGIGIWAVKTHHSGGIPHPHISQEGSMCFGNVGPVIEEALDERRFADAFEVVIRWMVGGYEDSLARHKITEWPIAHHEELAA